MDNLDIFLDILLKPPQPLMGLFFHPWSLSHYTWRPFPIKAVALKHAVGRVLSSDWPVDGFLMVAYVLDKKFSLNLKIRRPFSRKPTDHFPIGLKEVGVAEWWDLSEEVLKCWGGGCPMYGKVQVNKFEYVQEDWGVSKHVGRESSYMVRSK